MTGFRPMEPGLTSGLAGLAGPGAMYSRDAHARHATAGGAGPGDIKLFHEHALVDKGGVVGGWARFRKRAWSSAGPKKGAGGRPVGLCQGQPGTSRGRRMIDTYWRGRTRERS